MSQQINLLNPSLIKQKDFLNPNTISITLGILLVCMLGYYSYVMKQLSSLTLQRSQIAEELSNTQAKLKQVAVLHTPHEMNKALVEKIAQLEQKETMQKQILQTVNLSSATPEKGYAALMRAFARQSLDGLWLTSFSVDSRSEQLNISGRTLHGDLVPEYISRLGNEPALKGKLFSALNMSLPKADDTKKAAVAAQPLPSQNTNIVNSDIKNTAATLTTSSATANVSNDAGYIEFSLQSIDENSVAAISDSSKENKL